MCDTKNENQENPTPGFHGENCKYNGSDIDYEIACDECDFFLICFPDWEAANSAGYFKTTIQTASSAALKAFLQASTSITDDEIKINLQVMNELNNRKNNL